MKNIKNLSDDTIVEIAVPKALYESIKRQLAIKEAMKIGSKDFTYKDKTGREKYVTADNIEDAKNKVQKFGADPKTVKQVSKGITEKKKLNEGKSTIYASYNNSPDDLDYIESVLADAGISSSVKVGGFDEVEIIVDKKDIKRAMDVLRADGIQAS